MFILNRPVFFETISKDIYGLFVGFCERYIAAVSARIYRYMVFTFYIASQDDILARQKFLEYRTIIYPIFQIEFSCISSKTNQSIRAQQKIEQACIFEGKYFLQ